DSGSSESRERLKGKTMEWYVLQFTTTRFAAVFAHLERLNFSYFCPMETERYRRPDKIISYRERRLPLFPGYLFIQADFEEVHSTTITAIPYVQRFISFGGEPLPVPEDVMAELLYRQSHTTAQANLLRKSIPHDFAEILLMDNPQQRSMAFIHYITERSLTHKMKRKKNDCYPKKNRNETQAPT
ncbi:TPA: transcription termination/antitermination NusG family protein, partial [Klebsiella pneumoniae]